MFFCCLSPHAQEYQEVDTNLGEYLPFAVIVDKQGYLVDKPGAIQRATNLCHSCVKMGGKWLFYNVQTKGQESSIMQIILNKCVINF